MVVLKRKLIFFVLFCLLVSSVYSPNLAFSQGVNSNGIPAEYVETIEMTNIYNKEQKIVGEFYPGIQLSIDNIQDGKVYFKWDGDLVYIDEKSIQIVSAESINFTQVSGEAEATPEKILTHTQTEVYTDDSLITPILKLAPEVEYSITKKVGEYYSITLGNREGIIRATDVELLNPSIEQVKTPMESNTSFQESLTIKSEVENPSVSYTAHVQDIGWQTPVSDGQMSGTEGQAKRLEGIKISVNNVQDLGVKYSTHVQDYGWLDYVADGQVSGTTGKAKRLEAIKIELTGSKAGNYDIYYRVHAESYGWMNWVKNGEISGTSGESKRLEAFEIKIVVKGSTPPGEPEEPVDLGPSVTYKTHVQSDGWLDAVSDGELSGTVDQEKRLEALQISLENTPYTGGISYKTHVQDYGWMDSVSDGETSGITGENKRVESIQIKLIGEMVNHYDVYYRVYQQTFGWLDWVKNGESAGTEGVSKQLEAIEVVLVKKGGEAPGSNFTEPSVVYTTHVENYGWLDFASNGAMSGTSGEAKRLEAIKINLEHAPYSGNIVYSTHVENYGWLNEVSNGEISGTSGQSKRLEAIKINLTGDLVKYYDVYYRVHAQDYGWLGWAKNGMKAGTQGGSRRLEAIEIKLVLKGLGESVSEFAAFRQARTVFLDPGHGGNDPGAVVGIYHEADLNLAVAKKVQSLLIDLGYGVIMSRTSDTSVSLLDRPQMANNSNADIFVSIHTNSTAGGTTSATGIESYYYKYYPEYPSKINEALHNNPERISRSVSLANLIHENMVDYTGATNRGIHGETLAVVRESAMPATLLELGFINNSSDRQKLFTDSYQNTLARAIADGIEEYFKMY